MFNNDTGWGLLRQKIYRPLEYKNKHWKGYAIHGTNKPNSIGKEISHGCIQMFNQDVLKLLKLIKNKTSLIIMSKEDG